jgi:hypothetical protein
VRLSAANLFVREVGAVGGWLEGSSDGAARSAESTQNVTPGVGEHGDSPTTSASGFAA